MDNVIWAARFFGVGEFSLELFESRRTEGLYVEAGSSFTEVLQEAISHGAEFYVRGSARATRDVKKTNAAVLCRRTGNEKNIGLRLNANEGLHTERDRGIHFGIAHQFPGNRCGLGDTRSDFNSQVGQ